MNAHKNAVELLNEYLASIEDLEKALSLFAPDAVLEFPYFSSIGIPSRLEGKEAIRALLEPFLESVSDFRFQNIKIYPLADPNQVFAEYEVNATVKETGRRYHQLYGGRLVAANGQIQLLREFTNNVDAALALFPNGLEDVKTIVHQE